MLLPTAYNLYLSKRETKQVCSHPRIGRPEADILNSRNKEALPDAKITRVTVQNGLNATLESEMGRGKKIPL